MPSQTKNLNQSSDQNKNQLPKKEPVFLMAVKIFLVVLIFTALAAIIIICGYLRSLPDKTDLPIVNPIVETQCEINSDCELVYVGLDKCPSSDSLIDDYECFNKDEAIKIRRNKGTNLCSFIGKFDRYFCKCENGKCEIVEYEYKVKLLQSAEILGVSLPIKIKEVLFYHDGGTTGVIIKDANNKDFFFCLDGRMREMEMEKESESYHIYFKATYPTDANAQKISISGEKEKAILNILQDWTNKQVFKEEQIKLLNIRTVVGLSEEELKIYRILKVIEELEDRNQADNQPDTSNWQTYRNEEFGFEVEYPGYFGASEKNNIISLINFYDSSQKIEILKSSGPPPETMDMKSVGMHKVLIDEYVSNIELFQGRFDNNKDKYYLRVFIFEKDIYYHAETDKDKLEELSSIFNQVLSTFKFIEN